MLRYKHGQRLEGTLDDEKDQSTYGIYDRTSAAALAWLRKRYPVDEKAAYEARVLRDEHDHQAEIIADAERIGIYKRRAPVPVENKRVDGRDMSRAMGGGDGGVYALAFKMERMRRNEERRKKELIRQETAMARQRQEKKGLLDRDTETSGVLPFLPSGP